MATQAKTKEKPGFLQSYVPILHWLPHYNRGWLAADIIAGLSVWALMVPQSLGYANISGVPVQYGLYAAFFGLLIYAIFAGTRHVVTGPSSTIAAVTGAAVLAVVAAGSTEAVQLVAAITVLAGLMYIVLAILKMGWISNFLSESVMTGFIFGIGIDVVIGQFGKITGTPESGANSWQKLANWIGGLSGTNMTTLLVGGGMLILLILLKLFAPKVPGALLAMILGIGATVIFSLGDSGVALVGAVPRGLPSFALPSLSLVSQNLGVVIPAAIGVLLVGFSESLASARQDASKYHYDISVNQEMLAQGMANTASGLFQGINVDGSLSKTAVAYSAGVKSQMANLAQAFFVLLTLLFLAPLFSSLPEAVLGAVVIEAVAFGLWKIAEMRRLYHARRFEFWIAMAALLGVLTFGTLQGVFIGITLSLLWLVWRASNPAIPVLGRLTGSKVYHDVSNYPDSKTYPGLVIIRFDGPLYFATASSLRDRIRELTIDVDPPVKAVILDMESCDIIDLEGSEELEDVVKELKESGIEFYMARTKKGIKQILEKDGVIDVIGSDHLYDHVYEAVDEALKAIPVSGDND